MTRVKKLIATPDDLTALAGRFHDAGHKFYLVGGCVRDSILGLAPKDFDVATDMHTEDVVRMLSKDYTVLPIGRAFGIATVVTPEGNTYEIATFRKDIGEGRRPDSVEFTTIEEDVKRRDLTINALFYDIMEGEIVDLVGGMKDLKEGVVRTVGRPTDRFREDPLRRLRTIRFSTRLNFRFDPETYFSVRDDSNLEGVSPERVREELCRAHSGAKTVSRLSELLRQTRMCDWIFPGLECDPVISSSRWVVWLAYILRWNDPDLVNRKLHELKYTREEVKQVTFLVRFQGLHVSNAYDLKKAFNGSGLPREDIEDFSKRLLRPDGDLVRVFLDWELSVKGDDLISEGMTGKAIGATIAMRETFIFSDLVQCHLHDQSLP